MRSRKAPSSIVSLLSVLCIVFVLILSGCSADSLSGPILGPETTIQADGGQGDDHNRGNKCGGGGGDHHNQGGC